MAIVRVDNLVIDTRAGTVSIGPPGTISAVTHEKLRTLWRTNAAINKEPFPVRTQRTSALEVDPTNYRVV